MINDIELVILYNKIIQLLISRSYDWKYFLEVQMKLTVIGCWGGYPKANIKQLLLTQLPYNDYLSKLVFQAKNIIKEKFN